MKREVVGGFIVLLFIFSVFVFSSTGKANYVVVTEYDYIVYRQGNTIYAFDSSGLIYQSSSADEVINYVLKNVKNYQSVYVKPGIYWIDEPIVMKNKVGVKLVFAGEVKPVISFPKNEFMFKIIGDDWNSNRDNVIKIEHIDARGFASGVLIQDGFRNYVSVVRADNVVIGIEFRNYNAWSEANVVRDSQIYGIRKYGILFRRINHGTKSFKGTLVENVFFGLAKDGAVGIYIGRGVSVYEGMFKHVNGWSNGKRQVLISINGYVDKSLFENVAMESSRRRPYTYVIKIGRYMGGKPTFINVRAGDLSGSIYNPYRKRIVRINS